MGLTGVRFPRAETLAWPLVGLTVLWGCRPKAVAKPMPPPTSLRIVAVGDILMHQDVKRSALREPQGFPALWADLVPLFQSADLAFGNLETPVAPATGRPGVPFQFNAPAILPSALRASGFTVLSTANNHAFDQGSLGVRETLHRLRAERLVALGSGTSQPEAEEVQVLERAGFRIACLGFTDLFNLDLNRRATEPWVRPLDLTSAVQSIQAARRAADLVVVSVHWGNEYQHLPTRRQRDAARALVAAGADLILGHHPHVLQPVEWVEGGGRRALVAFSLGNFISNQDRMYRADLFPVAAGDSRDGAALQVRFERSEEPGAGVHLAEAVVEPLWTENQVEAGLGGRQIRVIRVGVAESRVRAELDQLGDPVEGPRIQPDAQRRRQAILDKQESLRTLILRRQRVAQSIGEAFVVRP